MSAVIKAITTDNVVYLSTYKVMKSLRPSLIAYKNTLLTLSPAAFEQEKLALHYAAQANPDDVVVKLKLERIGEIERG